MTTTYQQLRYLGGGYFGEVWLEHDTGLDRLCAAKYLRRHASTIGAADPFAEARAMLQAEHDHVVRVYSADVENGDPVIRMEYLPEGSIQDRYQGEPVDVITALRAIEDACRGLECLHGRRLLHRDMKPANLMIAPGGTVKVSDFGLACGQNEVAKAPVGYVSHLPPEALPSPGYIDSVAGDVYATGATLYRLLNGDDLTRRGLTATSDLSQLIVAGKFPRRDRFALHVHDPLRRVVRKALHTESSRRYPSASHLRHAIESARPVVSWAEVRGSADPTWQGCSVDGTATWRARISAGAGGRLLFTLERRLDGKSYRAIGAARGAFDDVRQAQEHAAVVLQQTATHGRL